MTIPLTYSLERTTDATIEPVTLADVKKWVGIADSETGWDDTLNSLIAAARNRVEKDTRRALISQTWTLKLDEFPSFDEFIELPVPTLINVTTGGITYLNSTGGTSTFLPANWEIDTNRTPGVLYLKFDKDWPSNVRLIQNAVSVVFSAGYGSTRSDVPDEATIAIKQLVKDSFDCPGLEGPANKDAYWSWISGLQWGDYR